MLFTLRCFTLKLSSPLASLPLLWLSPPLLPPLLPQLTGLSSWSKSVCLDVEDMEDPPKTDEGLRGDSFWARKLDVGKLGWAWRKIEDVKSSNKGGSATAGWNLPWWTPPFLANPFPGSPGGNGGGGPSSPTAPTRSRSSDLSFSSCRRWSKSCLIFRPNALLSEPCRLKKTILQPNFPIFKMLSGPAFQLLTCELLHVENFANCGKNKKIVSNR